VSIRRVKTITAIIVIVLVQCTLIKSHSAARGSIQIHTATTDTSGRAGKLTYSGAYFMHVYNRKNNRKDTTITTCNPGEGVNVPWIIDKKIFPPLKHNCV
jgi:hypothetical protein